MWYCNVWFLYIYIYIVFSLLRNGNCHPASDWKMERARVLKFQMAATPLFSQEANCKHLFFFFFSKLLRSQNSSTLETSTWRTWKKHIPTIDPMKMIYIYIWDVSFMHLYVCLKFCWVVVSVTFRFEDVIPMLEGGPASLLPNCINEPQMATPRLYKSHLRCHLGWSNGKKQVKQPRSWLVHQPTHP